MVGPHDWDSESKIGDYVQRRKAYIYDWTKDGLQHTTEAISYFTGMHEAFKPVLEHYLYECYSDQLDLIDKLLYKKRVKEIAEPKAKFADSLIEGRGEWIDIGAGVGDLVLALKKMGWNSKGYESDKSEVIFAKSMGVDLINKFLKPSDLSIIRKAKVVSSLNFLEHLKNPKSFVFNISKNMSIGSYFLFEVPRWPSISAVANKCFPELSSRNIYSPDHLHIFSDKSIGIMLDNSKLEIVSSWYYGQDIYELFGNVFANSNFQNHDLVDKSISIVNQLQKIVDKSGLSDTVLILAKKYL